jgi:hypothetical protein
MAPRARAARSATPLRTPRDAERFLDAHGVVWRYGEAKGLPLASLRAAVGPIDSTRALETSIVLTNHLLATGVGIEVNVIADRLAIVHRSLLPPLYALVRRGRTPDDLDGLDLRARSAYALIKQRREVSAGDVRAHLGLARDPRHDPAYEALADLQRQLLVARGPFEMAKTGIPYLSAEGYPYHLLHVRHPDLVRDARALGVDTAAGQWIAGALVKAGPITPRKIAGLFRRFMSADEVARAGGGKSS